MAKEIKVKYLGKDDRLYRFEDLQTEEVYEVGIWHEKTFISELQKDVAAYISVDEGKNGLWWCNDYRVHNAQDPVPTSKPTSKPSNRVPMNGARMGMIVNNAVQIELHDAKIENRKVNLKNIDGNIIALDPVVKKNE